MKTRALPALALVVLAVVAFGAGACGSGRSPKASGVILFTSDSRPPGSREIQSVGPDGKGWFRLTRHQPQGLFPAWSPTGKTIAFVVSSGSADDPDRFDIATVDRNGRNLRRLFHWRGRKDVGLRGPSWSPDGRLIAFQNDLGRVWVMRADGSGLRSLGDGGMPFGTFAWSPDGRRLVTSTCRSSTAPSTSGREDCGLSVVRATGGKWRRITRPQTRSEMAAETMAYPADWSPDGRRIAFTYAGGWAGAVVVVGSGGGRQTVITNTGSAPTWSPDGRRIAFIGETEYQDPLGVWVARPDGSGRRRLANLPGNEFALAWARSSRELVVATQRRHRVALYVLSAGTGRYAPLTEARAARLGAVDGGSDQPWAPTGRALALARWDGLGYSLAIVEPAGRVTRLLGPAVDAKPVWSPSGDRFAFERRTGSRTDIYTAPANGSNVRRLVMGRRPVWSPDGISIAFERAGEIMVIAADGSGQKRVAAGSDATWSPDSARVAFTRGGSLWTAARNGAATHRILASGFGVIRLEPALNGGPRCLEPRVDRPVWAPTGDTIAFLRHCSSEDGVIVYETVEIVKADGSRLHRIHVGSGYGGSLAWSPDGTSIAYSGGSDALILHPDGSRGRRVGEGLSPAWSPDGTKLAVVREGAGFDTDIWVIDTRTARANRATRGGQNLEPAWRPNGDRSR